MFAAVKSRLVSFFSSNTETPAECTPNKRKRTHSNMNQSFSPPDKRKKSTDKYDEMNVVTKWGLSNVLKYVTGMDQHPSEKFIPAPVTSTDKGSVLSTTQRTHRGALSQISNRNTMVFDLTIDNDSIEVIDDENDADISKISIDVCDLQYPNSKPLGFLSRKQDDDSFISIRLEEKRRYKELLEKFTSAGVSGVCFSENLVENIHHEVLSISDCSEYDYYSNKNYVQIDLTQKVSYKSNRKFFNEILKKSNLSSSLSLMSSASQNEETLDKSLEEDFQKSKNQSSLLDLCWIKKWRETLDPVSLERERQIKDEERKVALIKQIKEDKFEKLLKKLNQKCDGEFPELTDDMLKVVKKVLSHGAPSEILAHGFDADITRADLSTLRDSCWLNDEVINFYFNLLKERSEKNSNLPKVHIFNTFFYPKIIKTGFAGVKRWTRKTDIFSFDMVLIPIHLGMHWCLAEINFVNKQLVYYDSLKGNNMNCIVALKDYLLREFKDKKNENFDFSGWLELMPKDIPEQMNGCDCGVFACKYAEYRSRNAKFTFSQENMPYFRQRMIYEIASKKLL